MFKWFWTIFSLGAPVLISAESILKLDIFLYHWHFFFTNQLTGFFVPLHNVCMLNISLQARRAVSNLTILISCYVVGWFRWVLNHFVLLDLVSVHDPPWFVRRIENGAVWLAPCKKNQSKWERIGKATSLSRIGSLPKDRGNLIFCNRKRLPTKMQTAARKEHVNFSSQDISLSPVMAGDWTLRLKSTKVCLGNWKA